MAEDSAQKTVTVTNKLRLHVFELTAIQQLPIIHTTINRNDAVEYMLGRVMNASQQKNIEEAIDNLCENLVWTWAYYHTLSGLHKVAKDLPTLLDPYPQFISCLYHGLFDALFLKLHHFVDSSKGASGFPSLFKLLRRYCPDDNALLDQIRIDEESLSKEANVHKITNWRNQVVAHLTRSHRDSEFFADNRLHFSEIQELIAFLESTIETYSKRLLQRVNDTRYPSMAVAQEIANLLTRRDAEEQLLPEG